MAIRPGFIIPAAGTTTANLPSSQPDQGDFVTLGNQRYGVIAGCDISYIPGGAGQPGTVRIGSGPNLVKVNDVLYLVDTGATATVSTTVGTNDRIDLVVYDSVRGLTVITGAPAADPVMPDLSASMTLLFVLYVQLVNAKVTVIDKRIFLAHALISIVDATTTLVENRDGNGSPVFTVLGDGTHQWGLADAYLRRTGVNELTLNNKLIVGTLVAESVSIAGSTPITSINHSRGTTLPAAGEVGDQFTNTTTGALYIYQPGGWQSIATSANASVPVGTIISSELPFEPNKDTVLAGFLPLDGRTINYTDYPAYFQAKGVPGGSLTLSDARGCYLAQPANGVNAAIGSRFGRTSNLITISESQLAAHRHQSTVTQTAPGGAFLPTGTTSPAGLHGHAIGTDGAHGHIAVDQGHYHDPPWGPGDGLGFMVDSPNAHQNNRGGPIGLLLPSTMQPYPANNYPGPADGASNIAYLASPAATTGIGRANIAVNTTGSAHSHSSDVVPAHVHPISFDGVVPHTHSVPTHATVGSGSSIDITPQSIAVNYYVKVA